MGKKSADGKPGGRVSSYAFFVKTCREEHGRKHPHDKVDFKEFSKKCSEKWGNMKGDGKQRFIEMANKDKERHEGQMKTYEAQMKQKGEPVTTSKGKKRKAKKDPNAPKRALSAFFFFCNEKRDAVRKENPDMRIGDVAKNLGAQWQATSDEKRKKYDSQAAEDKIRYAKAMEQYNKKAKKAPPPEPESEDESEEESEEEESD